MTLTISITPLLAERLREAALRQGIDVDQVALGILEAGLPSAERRQRSIALLQSWIDDSDEAEQRETGDYLERTLDEDRLSNRPLIPPELKGKTW